MCLVSDRYGMSLHFERILKATGQLGSGSKSILEINPRHPIVKRLKAEPDETRFAEWSHLLFDQAVLAEGGHLSDPASFVKRINRLMLNMAGDGGARI